MEYRLLGRTGLQVSSVCLGTMQMGWRIDEAKSIEVLDAFIERGGTFIDTADMYSSWVEGNPGGVSEAILGRWMRSRGNRDRIVLATKCRGKMWEGPDGEGLSRSHILRACEESLRRLQTDRIDLYQTHWDDDVVPQEETASALDDLVRAGKVRFVGCSNFKAARLGTALSISDRRGLARYACLQPLYNFIVREKFEGDLERLCRSEGLAVIPYSPLAGGFLTGRYSQRSAPPGTDRIENNLQRYGTPLGYERLERLRTFAPPHGLTLIQAALGWLYAQPAVTAPIVGANSAAQLEENLKAAETRLTPTQAGEVG
ncbi:MAG: aldo/keto reductase [Planctomycetes bacterium]|nr:aldo/keto reductase [Planctomycetota bacterium]